MSQRNKSLFPGAILIAIGVLFLLHELGIFYFRWRHFYPLVFLALGAVFIAAVFTKNQKGAVFPGTILLSLGLFFFLRNYGYWSLDYYFYDAHEFWPIFLIATGLGFVALYLMKSDDWGVLIPGGVLIFVGFLFLLRNLRVMRWADFQDFWPVILIAIGLSIVIKSLRKKPQKAVQTGGQAEAP